MTKLLEKPILRTLPIFYAQATATTARRFNFGWMLVLSIIGSAVTAAEAPTLFAGVAAFVINFLVCLLFIGLVVFIWDWLVGSQH